MHLQIVDSTQIRKQFHKVPFVVYKGDKNWAPLLEGMVEDVFTPAKNPSFKNGEAVRWVLLGAKGELLGRIAAFVNYDKAKAFEQPTGACGFFECVNNQEAANKLFDAARDWLKERGMEAMDGPVNFGENYINWGLLVDGFMPQGFGMPYNPKYYQALFENYGFRMYFQQFSYHLDTTMPELPERFWKVAEWVAKKPQFSFEHFSWDNPEKYIDDFVRVYDGAWQFHEHYKPLDKDDLRDFLKSAKPILEPEFIWFAYHEGVPIALFVMLPDLNQILIKLKGKLNFWGILTFLWLKKQKTMTRTRSLIIGIVPQFQRSGVDAAIFWHLRPVMYRKHWYNEMELSWAGDFNPKVVALYESVGGKHVKTHYTMRYLFDSTKPFSRAPIIGAEKEEEKK